MLFVNYIKFLFFSNVHNIVLSGFKVTDLLVSCTNDDSNVMEPDCGQILKFHIKWGHSHDDTKLKYVMMNLALFMAKPRF